MKKFDIACMKANEYEQREKNAFCKTREFKMRIIDLAPGQGMPRSDMKSHVVFVCIEGEAEVSVGIDNVSISRGQGLVTEPATISMQTKAGARILGIQIHGARTEK
jgi:quercetin dioxygenase-like cupin family protein